MTPRSTAQSRRTPSQLSLKCGSKDADDRNLTPRTLTPQTPRRRSTRVVASNTPGCADLPKFQPEVTPKPIDRTTRHEPTDNQPLWTSFLTLKYGQEPTPKPKAAPKRKATHQIISHVPTKNPPPWTGFLTLTYSQTLLRSGRVLPNFVHGEGFTIHPAELREISVPDDYPTIDSGIDVTTPANLPLNVEDATGTGTRQVVKMAPVLEPGMGRMQDALKDVVQNLFDMQSQVHGYVDETQPVLVEKMIDLTTSLSTLQHAAMVNRLPSIPPELIDYVDEGRNPDIYTREFVELVQRGNAVVNGKREAFRGFSEVFARKLIEAKGDGRGGVDVEREVGRVLKNAGLDLGAGGAGAENGVRVKIEEGEEQKEV